MEDAARQYIDAIAPEHRPTFDRIHDLVLAEYPDASVDFAYKMPTYNVGPRRLHVAVWKHGVSLYGWKHEPERGFAARHPELIASRGTIRLRPDDADRIPDDEFRELIRATLDD